MQPRAYAAQLGGQSPTTQRVLPDTPQGGTHIEVWHATSAA